MHITARRAVLGLGSNLGDRIATLRSAVRELSTSEGVRVVAVAPVWRTEPVGPPQPEYLNSAVLVETTLEPASLLAQALAVETKLGRNRVGRWSARTLDIDLLWMADLVVDAAGLQVPHPELTRRAFALAPLVALVPDCVDPVDGVPYAAKLAALPGVSVFPAGEMLDDTADLGA